MFDASSRPAQLEAIALPWPFCILLAQIGGRKFVAVWHMKNVYEVLRQKELELAKVETEVQALRLAAPLLSEQNEGIDDDHKAAAAGATVQSRANWMPQAVNAAPQPADVSSWDDKRKSWP